MIQVHFNGDSKGDAMTNESTAAMGIQTAIETLNRMKHRGRIWHKEDLAEESNPYGMSALDVLIIALVVQRSGN